MLNFKLSEFIYSDIAKKNNINNMPDISSLDNLLNLIYFCMQPLRNLLHQPIIITSGYRSTNLNKLAGGANKSAHLKGGAADFIVKNYSISDAFNVIKNSNIEFDELINEHNNWIHISYFKGNNRRKILYIK